MRIFGREPAVIVGLVQAAITVAIVMGVISADAEQTGLIMAAVAAVGGILLALTTVDTLLGAVVGAIEAVVALLVGYGLNVTADKTAAIIGLVTAVFALWHRTQTSPAPSPSFT